MYHILTIVCGCRFQKLLLAHPSCLQWSLFYFLLPIPEIFDYVVSSQTFNNRLAHEDNQTLMQDILRIGYEASEKGVAIDMFTSYVDFREDRLFYYSPEEIFRFSKTLTKRVLLRHDYPLFEFTVYLYRDFAGWKK